MKLKKCIILVSLVIGLSGCNSNNEEPLNQDFGELQQKKEELFEVVKNETILVSEEELQGLQENIEVQETIDYAKYGAANRVCATNQEKNMQSLFCVDQNTGVIYFINQNKDWYIYRLSDGMAEVAVEIPARELHMLNGTLYFIVDGYGKYEFDTIAEGDIYAYTPAKGSVTQIFSASNMDSRIEHISPYEDGIAFYCIEYKKVNDDGVEQSVENVLEATKVYFNCYFYSFDTTAVKKDTYKRVYPGWQDYYLMQTYTEDGWKTIFRSRTDEAENVIDWNVNAGTSMVIEDTMYAMSNSNFYMTDIIGGEQKIFDCKAMLENTVPERFSNFPDTAECLQYFTVTEDYIWVTAVNHYLLRIEPVSGEITCFQMPGTNYRLDNLYSDGRNLYAMYAAGTTGMGAVSSESLVRVDTGQVIGYDMLYNIPMLGIEYLTE